MAKPRVLLVRDAAVGDAIMITPAIRYWHSRGYRVDVACKRFVGNAVYSSNPHVHACIELERQDDLAARERAIDKIKHRHPYDLVFDLAGTCEGRFLYHSIREEYHAPTELRRFYAEGADYYKHINHDCCGVRDDSLLPEMFYSQQELRWWETFRSRNIGVKLVQVQLDGSSMNKCYPYWWQVIKALQLDPRVIVITTGGKLGHVLEQEAVGMGCDPERIWACCANEKYTLRDSLIMPAFVDLVIGPETGILNASACWDVPKIVLMSHSAPENLCRRWLNCQPITSPVKCSPCYRIVSAGDPCNYVTEPPEIAGAMACMAAISPQTIVEKARKILECSQRKTCFNNQAHNLSLIHI